MFSLGFTFEVKTSLGERVLNLLGGGGSNFFLQVREGRDHFFVYETETETEEKKVGDRDQDRDLFISFFLYETENENLSLSKQVRD